MRKIREWSHVKGSTYVTIDWDELEDELKLLLIDAVCETGHIEFDPKKELDEAELGLFFLSSGYDDPGKYSGPPEDCYPACSDEERVMDSVELYSWGHRIELKEDVALKLFEKFQYEVDKAEIGD